MGLQEHYPQGKEPKGAPQRAGSVSRIFPSNAGGRGGDCRVGLLDMFSFLCLLLSYYLCFIFNSANPLF